MSSCGNAVVREGMDYWKQQLKRERDAVNKELKQARQELARAEQKWKLEGSFRAVSLTLYMLTDQSLGAVANYMRRHALQMQWEPKCDDDLKLLFLDVLQDAGDEELRALTHEGACNPNDATRAHKEAQEWRVAVWAAGQNRRGCAPSTSAILYRLEVYRMDIPPNFRPPSRGLAPTSVNRKFAHRLRQRCGGRVGKVRFQDRIGVEEARAKTFALWQWSNFLAGQVPDGKRPLWINMDETSVSLMPEGSVGNIFLSKGERPTQQATTNERRTHLTHVSFVCSDPEIQRVLPQFIIGNEYSIPAHRLAEISVLTTCTSGAYRARG